MSTSTEQQMTSKTPTTAALPVVTRRGGRLSAGFDPIEVLLRGRAFFALIVIIVVFSLLSPNYLTVSNVLVMSQHVAVYAILAVGMLMVIMNGGIDLSVGATLGLSGVVAGYVMQGVNLPAWGIVLYPSVWVTVILALATGAFVGFVNGILIARFRVAPFVATLGMLYVVRGVALLITDGLTYPNLDGRAELGNTGFDALGFNALFGLPVAVVVMIVIAVLASLLLNKAPFGRWLYASGGNERAAELSGIPVVRVKLSVYVMSGLCAAVGGIIVASQLTSANPTAGESFELTAIAAVVIGGASLAGGSGNVRGTLLGAFVIGFLSDGLVIVGVSEYWQMIFKGGVIILAVLLNAIHYKSRRKSAQASQLTPPNTSSGLPSNRPASTEKTAG